MKNKGLTYVLLIIVGIIWYKVFFRVKENLFGEGEIVQSTSLLPHSFTPVARDTFMLKADYRDPFGWAVSTPRAAENPEPFISAPVLSVVKPKQLWPKLRYYGLVKKTNSNSPLAILNIDGMNFTLRKGEKVFDGIFIKAIGRDSVVINYQKETRVVWRD